MPSNPPATPKPKKLAKKNATSASGILDKLCGDLAYILDEIAEPNISQAYRGDLKAIYATIEAQALSLALRLPRNFLFDRYIAKTGSIELLRCLPIETNLAVAPWSHSLSSMMRVSGVSYLEELEKRFCFDTNTLLHLIVEAEIDHQWLPMLERHAFNKLTESQFIPLWGPEFQRNGGISRLFAAAPTVAPRLLKRQCDMWPDLAKQLRKTLDPKKHPQDMAGFAGATGMSGMANVIVNASCRDGSSHAKMKIHSDIEDFHLAACTPWPTEEEEAA